MKSSIRLGNGITDIEFSTSGDLIACSTVDESVFFLKFPTFELIREYHDLGFINKLCWLYQENKIFAGTKEGNLLIIECDKSNCEIINKTEEENPQITFVTSSQHIYCIFGYYDGGVSVVLKKGQNQYFVRCHSLPITGIEVTKQEDCFVTTSLDGIMRVWSLYALTGSHCKHQCLYSFQISKQPITSFRLTSDSSFAACACLDGFIRFHSIKSNESKSYSCVYSTNRHPSQI